MATDLADELAAMIDRPVIEEPAMRALRHIWLEAVMAEGQAVETFEDVAELLQRGLTPD